MGKNRTAKRRFLAYVGDKQARASICEGEVPEVFLGTLMGVINEELPSGKRDKAKGYIPDPGSQTVTIDYYYGNKEAGGVVITKEDGCPIFITLSRHDIANGPPDKLKSSLDEAWALAQAMCPNRKPLKEVQNA